MKRDQVQVTDTVGGQCDVSDGGERKVRIASKVAEASNFWDWVDSAESFDALAKELIRRDKAYTYRKQDAFK